MEAPGVKIICRHMLVSGISLMGKLVQGVRRDSLKSSLIVYTFSKLQSNEGTLKIGLCQHCTISSLKFISVSVGQIDVTSYDLTVIVRVVFRERNEYELALV